MPLHMTKIAFGAKNFDDIRGWFDERRKREMKLTTRYLPKRHEEMVGGSLYWIFEHNIVGRSPIIGFEQTPEGRWWIRLEPTLVPVEPRPKRAHQGWRYLKADDAPRDLPAGEDPGDVLPGKLAGQLLKLGLI